MKTSTTARQVFRRLGLGSIFVAMAFLHDPAHAETSTQSSAQATSETPEIGKKIWVQVQAGISLLDDHSDTPVKRTGLGLQVGTRGPSGWGVFVNAEGNRSIEFSGDKPDIDYLQVGPGVEYLFHSRQIRSSISTGATVLTKAVNDEQVGKRGWYLDVRPVSVRFPMEAGGVIEFTPLNIDISIPEESGSLSMYGNFTVISYEW